MALPSFNPLSAVRAVICVYELYAGAAAAVTAFLSAGLTVVYRVFVYIVFRTQLREESGVAPFVRSVEGWAVMRSAVFAAFEFKV